MPNLGVSPLDPDSPVGRVRLNLGDINGSPLDPAVEGFASYDRFSDIEITAFLLTSRDSVARATGTAIKQIALSAALTGRSIKTDDLSIDSRSRGSDLLAIAQSWFDQADAEDAAGAADFFDVVPFGGRLAPGSRPAVAPTPAPTDNLTESPLYPGLWS